MIAPTVRRIGFSLFIACGLFSMIFSAIICNKTADEHELEKQASADAYAKIHGLILYTAVVPICLIYIIFFALQADYFMNAFIGYLPDGISYSEYISGIIGGRYKTIGQMQLEQISGEHRT